ncbi:phage SPbeta [Bacillus thuringiensis YBT-1518]|uniref:Phage SPbeta n=1 Tax=Bacillus thuringiensis YBT-1518 TaxID=529122 RepID=A0A9W3KAG7_BACTU|nr:phage SPbeta [Bacillus thuringiensis YBT-1518]
MKLTAIFPRTNISILGVHLPDPSTLGNYDIYEGFVFISEEVSWRFKLYPSEEDDGPTWAGRIDIITAEMKGVQIQVRPSNSKTEKLGLPILTNSIKSCKCNTKARVKGRSQAVAELLRMEELEL